MLLLQGNAMPHVESKICGKLKGVPVSCARIATLLCAAALLASSAQGATLHVPAEYPTIQAGIDAAQAGDVVMVAPGTYTDVELRTLELRPYASIAFLKDGVTIKSEKGPLVTHLDMDGFLAPFPSVIAGDDLISGATTIDGFSLTGIVPGVLGGTAAYIEDSGVVTIRNCVFHDIAVGNVNAAVVLAFDSQVSLENCEFRDCTAIQGEGMSVSAHGLLLQVKECLFVRCDRAIFHGDVYGGTTIIQNSIFRDCSSAIPTVFALASRLIAEGCTFEGNQIGGCLGVVHNETEARVVNCLFRHNQAPQGAGVLAYDNPANLWIEGNLFWDCKASGEDGVGSALDIIGSFYIHQNTFVGCGSENAQNGAVVNVVVESESRFVQNVLAFSTGSGTALKVVGIIPDDDCNIFWSNEGGNARGYRIGQIDRIADPEFCGPGIGDFSVHATSPCLPKNSPFCGGVGAFGLGCGPVTIESKSWGAIKGLYR